MKVELQIDAANMGETVVDMFKNLPAEKREELATKVLHDWLREPYEVEKLTADRAALEYARARNSGYHGSANKTDEDLRGGYEYREFYAKHKSSRQLMIEEITKATIEHHKKAVVEQIKADPQMNAVLTETIASIKENFPKYVHDAMIAWFASHLQSMGSGISQALMQSSAAENQVKQIAQRVGLQ